MAVRTHEHAHSMHITIVFFLCHSPSRLLSHPRTHTQLWLRDHALDRYGNLTEEQDVYLPQASHTNVAWNRGPNEQFLKLFEWM
jgi:hypothetical protein